MSGWVSELSAAYERAPVFRASDWHMWREMAREHVRLANHVRRTVAVTETSAPEPYASAYEMALDVSMGFFVVSTANSDHPAWSTRENVAFRVVHDVLGHCAPLVTRHWTLAPAADFSLAGELTACRWHAQRIGRHLWPALLTECLGQVARRHVLGRFDAQKVAALDADPEVHLAAA